jgi:glutamate-1-semialdehyde 2,1-aminomutase
MIIRKGKNKYLFTKKNIKLLDFCLSNGAMILGHSNQIFISSIKNEIINGSNYSEKNVNNEKYKKELHKNFSEFNEFIFCNSGSEANIRAIRIAKSLNNRKKIAIISGSWHGSIDQLMFDLKKKNTVMSLSSGIEDYKKNIIILPNENLAESLKILNKNKNNISMLIFEPVRSSHPKINFDYLKSCISFCKKNKIIVCFDEIITGMRNEKLAFYKKYFLKPDMITFGKCFGGGLPIGILGVSKEIKNNKKFNKIFFGGTFSGNNFSSIVGLNTLKYVKANKKIIFYKIEKLSNMLSLNVNTFFKTHNLSFEINSFNSITRVNRLHKNENKMIKSSKNNSYIKELRNFLLKRKIFLSSNGNIYISYCHTLGDIKFLSKILIDFFKKKYLN